MDFRAPYRIVDLAEVPKTLKHESNGDVLELLVFLKLRVPINEHADESTNDACYQAY